jgi:MarR family transcriptional regulator for hemolysin
MTEKNCKNSQVECATKVHPGLKAFFGYSLYKTGLLYRDIIETIHLSKFGISASESGILYILNEGNVINQLTLGHEIGIDKASIVKLIDKLEELKLVRRDVDSHDRRSKLVSLTAKGKLTVSKMSEIRTQIEEQMFTTFSKEDQKHLKRLVPQLLEVLMNVKD